MERQPAIKCSIKEIVTSKFYEGDRENLKPSFVFTRFGEKISRVNVFGIVVDKFVSEESSYGTITINDFSDSIRVKVFKDKIEEIKKVNLGDNIVVIGKPRMWNNEIYINLEILKKIEDPNFETYRRLEILKKIIERKKILAEIFSLREKLSEEEFYNFVKEKYGFSEDETNFLLEIREERKDFKSKVIKIIKELDNGDGVDVIDVFVSTNLESVILDGILTELINSGVIIEIAPGRLKVRE